MSLSLKEVAERSVELYARKMHADSMPEEREKHRNAYDAICKELRALYASLLDALPIELIPADDATACEVCMLIALSHRMLAGCAKPHDLSSWLEVVEKVVDPQSVHLVVGVPKIGQQTEGVQ